MSLWRQLTSGLRVLTNRTTADQAVADEVQHYLEQATAEKLASGLSPDDARRAVRLELGNPTIVREQVRSYGWENIVGTFFADLRYAIRQLCQSPGFASTAILILALGIGATTAIFSVVNPILFKSLPYPHAGRVMMIWEMRRDGSPMAVTFGSYRGMVERSRSFD